METRRRTVLFVSSFANQKCMLASQRTRSEFASKIAAVCYFGVPHLELFSLESSRCWRWHSAASTKGWAAETEPTITAVDGVGLRSSATYCSHPENLFNVECRRVRIKEPSVNEPSATCVFMIYTDEGLAEVSLLGLSGARLEPRCHHGPWAPSRMIITV